MTTSDLNRYQHTLTCLLLAIGQESRFSRYQQRQVVKEFIDAGYERSLIEPLLGSISTEAWERAEAQLEEASQRGAQVLNIFHPDYPAPLREIADPPLVIFVLGSISCRFNVAVVGSRDASAYGLRVAKNLAFKITERGGVVVSGLARGIDAAAHRGAIDAANSLSISSKHREAPNSGIAVLGSGLFSLYPRENISLAEEIFASGGAIVSEYGLHTSPQKHFFPERNRIISALSDAVVVVEARQRSGALITARTALEQGKEVYAVPGSIESKTSYGPNRLLESGAIPLFDVNRLFENIPAGKAKYIYGSLADQNTTQKVKNTAFQDNISVGLDDIKANFSTDEFPLAIKLLYALLENKSCNFDELTAEMSIESSMLSVILSRLELLGIVQPFPGQNYSIDESIDTADFFKQILNSVKA